MNLFWYHNLDKILDKQKHFLLTFVRVFQKVFEVINAVGNFVAFSHKKKLLFDLCNISLRLQFFSSMGPWLNMCYAQYISIYEFSFYTLFYEQMKWKEKKMWCVGEFFPPSSLFIAIKMPQSWKISVEFQFQYLLGNICLKIVPISVVTFSLDLSI